MKRIASTPRLLCSLLLLCPLLFFSSCEEDIWFQRNPLRETAWRVINIEEQNPGNCPFRIGNLLVFGSTSSEFYTETFSGRQYGFWNLRGNRLTLSFDPSNRNNSISIYITQRSSDVLAFDCVDNLYNQRYRILVQLYRQSGYSLSEAKK